MKRWTLKLAAIVVPVMNCAVWACPLCKDSVPNSDTQAANAVPNAMNNSVYFMLGGLFLVIGMVSGVIIKGVRDADRTGTGKGGRGFPM